MSTKGSLRYHSIGDWKAGTKCSVHVYHECRENLYYLEVSVLSHVFPRIRLSTRIAIWAAERS